MENQADKQQSPIKEFTILIIDQDTFFVDFYRAEFAKYGVKTETAADGVAGLQKISEVHPAAILLDAILPKKDGFEVIAEVRKNPEFKETPIIVVSELAMEKDVQELMQLGATKTFSKLKTLPKDVVSFTNQLLGIPVAGVDATS